MILATDPQMSVTYEQIVYKENSESFVILEDKTLLLPFQIH